MNQALAMAPRLPDGQRLALGMGLSAGLHLLLAATLLLWPWDLRPAQPPELVQTVKLVELPPSPAPTPPSPPPPDVKPPEPAPPPRPQPRVPPRMDNRPASTSRPGPVFSAAQEKPVESGQAGVAVAGEAIGESGPPAAPASGGQAPPGPREAPPPAIDLGPYVRAVWQRIERQKRYPSLARARQEEGRVALRFNIHADGKINSLEVARSSGSQILDEAAVEAVRRGAPYPAPPQVRPGGGGLAMELTVAFELF